MGQWIGGDRDGNPFVTGREPGAGPDASGPTWRCATICARCTIWAASCRCRQSGGHHARDAGAGRCLTDHNVHRSDEPYRRALTGIYARLAATLRQLTGGEAARHAVAPQNAYASADAFLADLQIIDDSLSRYHGNALAPQRLRPLMRAVQVFGFYLSTVDLRQSSDKHEEVVRGCSRSPRSSSITACSKDAKCALLVRLLEHLRPARHGWRLRRPHAQRADPSSRPPSACASV